MQLLKRATSMNLQKVFIIIIEASVTHRHLCFCCPYFRSEQQLQAKQELKKKKSTWFQQDNLMFGNNEILVLFAHLVVVELLLWIDLLSVYSELLRASIIIWPCWRAVSCPYAAVSMVVVSQRRGFGFWCFADVLCSCLLLLLIEFHCRVLLMPGQTHRVTWEWDESVSARHSVINPSDKLLAISDASFLLWPRCNKWSLLINLRKKSCHTRKLC